MPFQHPGRTDVHVDGPLSSVSLAFIQSAEGFVADRVFPRLEVSKQSDLYFTYDRGYWNRAEMQKRAPGAESAGANYDLSTDSYRCDIWALHRDIADPVRSNADDPVRLDTEATEFLSLQALLRREKQWTSEHFVTGAWTTERAGVAATPTGTQFLRWDDAASTPIEDIRQGRRTVHQLTGFMPNVLTLSREVYDALLDHPDIVGRLDRGQTSGTARVMRQNLAELFELDEVLVADAIENTAAEGASNSHSRIAGKHALLSYRPASPGLLVPSAGYDFVWTGLGGDARIKTFRMEHLESDRVEIQMAFDLKLVAADLGAFFLDAVS